MKTSKLIFLAACLLLTGFSCKKEIPASDELPLVTQTGENTFGCLINGVPYAAYNKLTSGLFEPSSYGIRTSYGYPFNPPGNNYFNLDTVNPSSNSSYSSVEIQVNNMIKGVGDYPIEKFNGYFTDQSGPAITTAYVIKKDKDPKKYKRFIAIEGSGIIKITRFEHFTSAITSGIFNFRAYNEVNPSEIIEVTQGRFDINNKTLNR